MTLGINTTTAFPHTSTVQQHTFLNGPGFVVVVTSFTTLGSVLVLYMYYVFTKAYLKGVAVHVTHSFWELGYNQIKC